MTILSQSPSTVAPGAAQPSTGETIHIVTWRLLDYEGRELTYGGLQRWLLALIDLLRSRGHPVIVHQRAYAAFEQDLEPGVTIRGYHRGTIGARTTPLFNLMVHRAIPPHAPVIYMAEDVSYPRCRRRSLVIQHGIWWDGELSALGRRFAEHIVRHALRRTAAVLCVDTNFINWYRARWPNANHDTKLHFVPNFVDPATFGPQPEIPAAAVAPGERITICFPRRSEPRRGIMMMADVAPGLIQKFSNVDFRFVVGSGHHTEALRSRMHASGADTARWSIEVLPFDRMKEAYQRSAIITIPTICGEGTSLSAIEAMYFGCAIVSTWVGGLPNLIQDQHNGLLIPPRTEDLGTALEQLIEDADLRTRLGGRALADVMPRYGIARWRESVTDILDRHLALRPEVST